MDRTNVSPDWSLLQSFLAVAETGSLSAAAAQLGASQPTVGRHIRALETSLGVELFQRHPKGLAVTASGARILPQAREMRDAMSRIALTAEADAGQIEGTVRIACSVFMAHYVLPPILAELRRAEPAISLVLQPSDDSDNLTFREADIALRMYRPRQLDLVARHLGDFEIGVFAAQSYLEGRDRPRTLDDLRAHDLVGYDRSPLIRDAITDLGIPADAVSFATLSDNQAVYWELVRAGCGVGFTQAHIGRSDPEVDELHIDGLDIPPLPVWLTAQENARHIPRIARVWSLLDTAMSEVIRAQA